MSCSNLCVDNVVSIDAPVVKLIKKTTPSDLYMSMYLCTLGQKRGIVRSHTLQFTVRLAKYIHILNDLRFLFSPDPSLGEPKEGPTSPCLCPCAFALDAVVPPLCHHHSWHFPHPRQKRAVHILQLNLTPIKLYCHLDIEAGRELKGWRPSTNLYKLHLYVEILCFRRTFQYVPTNR